MCGLPLQPQALASDHSCRGAAGNVHSTATQVSASTRAKSAGGGLPGCCLRFLSWQHVRASPIPCTPHPVMPRPRRRWAPTAQRRRGPWAGVRVGEAKQPGPSTLADELLQQRARAANTLARARTSLPPFPPLPPPDLSAATNAPIGGRADRRRPPPPHELDEADTLSDTLSATTPVATPPPPNRSVAAAEQRRARVYHALGQMRLVPAAMRDGPADGGSRPAALEASACEHYLTPFASPAGSPRRCLRPGEAAPTQAEEATPGFTPPPSPTAQPALPRWQGARPPDALPGDRNSWLFVPLLHAAAGNLSVPALTDWQSLPDDAAGRFDTLAGALQAAPPAEPSCFARLLHGVAECDAQEMGAAPLGLPATDAAPVASLRALPAAPIPLATALRLAQAPDGYVSAAAQSAFLEAYGGAPLAAAARALADDLRAAMSHRIPPSTTRTSRSPSPTQKRAYAC